MCAVVGVLLK